LTVQPRAVRHSDALQATLQDLTRVADVERRPLGDVLRHLTETAATALRVRRVNVWLYDEARTHIVCLDHFDAETGVHGSGDTLGAADYPAYFAALEDLRTIAAIDAEEDVRTNELRDAYLRPHGITTMLDAPVVLSGGVVGVVCHEHVGPRREWLSVEKMFAGSVADLVALAVQTDHRVRAERERAELLERLHALQHVESLGLLAGTVAHDFNNILTAIGANTELLLGTALDGTQRDSAQDVLVAVRRAREICELLLTYAGRRPMAPVALDLGAAAGELSHLVARGAPAGVTVEVAVEDGAPVIRGDAAQIQQVALNLLTNAVDAVRDRGGAVAVRVFRSWFDGVARAPEWDWRRTPGEMITLEVMDNGAGMDAETWQRMFEPFFTTKAGGTGLGLAAALGIIRGHGGAVEISSAPGHGTTVRVTLPAVGTEA